MAAELAGSGGHWRKAGEWPRSCRMLWMILASLAAWIPAVVMGAARRFRAGLAVAVVVSLALAPLPVAPSSHDAAALIAAENALHAGLGEREMAGHGHSHEDGEGHERPAGHMHGHDPADHSHQLVFAAAEAGADQGARSQRWTPAMSHLADPGTAFGIDRPPKQASAS